MRVTDLAPPPVDHVNQPPADMLSDAQVIAELLSILVDLTGAVRRLSVNTMDMQQIGAKECVDRAANRLVRLKDHGAVFAE